MITYAALKRNISCFFVREIERHQWERLNPSGTHGDISRSPVLGQWQTTICFVKYATATEATVPVEVHPFFCGFRLEELYTTPKKQTL